MGKMEVYRAVADAKVASELAATSSPFTIEVRFLGGLTAAQQRAFADAADRWSRMIVGDLPSVKLPGGEIIDDVVIFAQGKKIDGSGGILGQAGPRELRPANAASGALLPATGIMTFDSADLAQMESDGSLGDVIAHEMGHVLGIGTIWTDLALISGEGTSNPTFTGAAASGEYAQLISASAAQAVPVENTGGPGTRDGHWRDTIFGTELMTGFVGGAGNPLSRLTVASLQDMGYIVNLAAAEPYTLPNLLELAESGKLKSAAALVERGVMLPVIPMTLPDDSMQ